MNEITREINKLMKGYQDELDKLAEEEFEAVAKDTVQELKSTSPKGSPHKRRYAEGWKVKKEAGVGKMNFIVHNATNYQLTHLLENGHIIRNKKGTYGRTGKFPHIAPAADKAAEQLIERLESKL